MNPYLVLGVSENASLEDCKKAWKKLCIKHHPDNNGNIDEFNRVQKAWEIIQSGTYVRQVKKKLKHKTLFEFEVY